MKPQYLGDSKDSFKWDYHDYLVSTLKYPCLAIALMLTPDDQTGHGKTKGDCFPARAEVLAFCRDLQESRDIERIKDLPVRTGAPYQVTLHKGASRPTSRADYFSGFDSTCDQIVFVDPDNGFEPEKSCEEAHVRYDDVARVIGQLSENSIVTVFQHFRRVPFREDFCRIKARLNGFASTALCWHSLMFVAIASSEIVIDRVRAVNAKYAANHPVDCLI